jgi:hypothetical protein
MKNIHSPLFLFLLIFSFFIISFIGIPPRAEETGGNPVLGNNVHKENTSFKLAWKILYKKEDIGYSISRFSFKQEQGLEKAKSDENTPMMLNEEGIKQFYIEFGVFKISYIEKTATTWNSSGLIISFNSTVEVNNTIEKRIFRRGKDGTAYLNIIKGDKTKEVIHTADEFDFTSGDLYLKGFKDASGDVSYKVLSLTDGKIKPLSYTFVGKEKVLAITGIEECRKVDVKGKKGGGLFLIGDLGIALSFNVNFLLGDFSFTPVDHRGLAEAERAIANISFSK